MQVLLVLVHVLTCVSLIALVLLQQGKGAEIGAAFGSGASSTLFGSPGASSFLFKVTAGLAALFFITSLGLGYFDAAQAKKAQILAIPAALLEQQQATQPQSQPQPQNTMPISISLPENKK